MPDSALRQIEMLRLVPRSPRSITVTKLVEHLASEGFEITTRTVQRDLNALASIFDLRNSRDGRTQRWFWSEDAEMLDIPGMAPQTALTMFMTELFLYDQLPRSITGHLAHHFDQAREILRKSGDLTNWTEKVRVVPRNQRLIQPKVDEDVLRVIYDSLLHDKKFQGRYLRRGVRTSKEYPVSPLGLVFRDGVTYLVATLRDYPEVRQLALHRFRSASPLDEKVVPPKGFKLDHYINQGAFDYPLGDFIDLEFKANNFVIEALKETPISHNQGVRPFDDNWVIVSARVKETEQLHWWLLGYGDQVQVLEPPHMRDWFKKKTRAMAKLYK